MTSPPPASPAPTRAGDVRSGAAAWSTCTDRRYSRSVVDDVGENVGGTHERSELESSFANGGDRTVRLAYDRYGSLVYTFCRRTVGHHDATELAQDVFVAAWRAQRSYDPGRGGLGGWLMAIARNKVIDHLRRRGRRPLTDADADSASIANLRNDEVDMVANRMLLAEALGELAPRARGRGTGVPARLDARTDRRQDPPPPRNGEERRPSKPAPLASRTRRAEQRRQP